MIELSAYQLDAIRKMKNGCILCGGVGSGKSRTALYYYLRCECGGDVKVNGVGGFKKMDHPRDLYIITTAKKRDSLEWEKECSAFALTDNREISHSGVKVTVDSWNNVKKYAKITGAFFIFDEQRVVGSGVWVKTFLNIARKNHWVLLSATPGDTWEDYIPVFVANGFYQNKTEFTTRHCVYSRFSKFPKIERYLDEWTLERYRAEVLVPLEDNRKTHRNNIVVKCDYDWVAYKRIMKLRWDPYEDCPIADGGKLCYLLRRVVNSDGSRIDKVLEILDEKWKAIIFYNFDYELELIRDALKDRKVKFAEWNGHKHEKLPAGKKWAYLVQYSAGSEGWNCITCDTIIFYSQNYSYKVLEQSSGRIDRMNTPFLELYYYHLMSGSGIDVAIRQKLKDKKNFSERAFCVKNGG